MGIKPKKWIQELVQRFQWGESIGVLAAAYEETPVVIEGILRRTMILAARRHRRTPRAAGAQPDPTPDRTLR